MEYLTAPNWSWACFRGTLIWTPGDSLSENSEHFATPPLVNFPAKLRLRNERRNFILMTPHYQDLDSSSDWLKQISHAARPNRSTTQIWVVTRHQYGISALVSQTSFGGKSVVGVAKCRLFSQAMKWLHMQLKLLSFHDSNAPNIWLFYCQYNVRKSGIWPRLSP